MGLRETLLRRRARLAAELAEVEAAIGAIEKPNLTTESASNTTYNNNDMPSQQPQKTVSKETRLRQAKHSRKRSPETERLRAAFAAKGDSMEMAAQRIQRKVGKDHAISQPYLSMAAKGVRPMWPKIAKAIEELYGFAATRESWPDLRSES